ncbi:MAG TPA: sulfatase-like hydrolase/transferase [Candidatus Polarisedimenticolaceae bacterium]|nr:sulfatase-like hydrolase/transferase [Candidatus Polarisedimenticolaceae bacterium]
MRVPVLLSALLLGISCGGGASTPPAGGGKGRTLVLVTIESLRADAALPEALKGLLSAGRTFTDAVSASPMARPSVASMLTGVAPDRSGVRDNLFDPLSADVPTVAEKLKAAGWSTGAFVGSPSCAKGFGLERGFDLYDAPSIPNAGPGRLLPPAREASTVAANAATWLGGLPPKSDVFAWVHLGELTALPFSLPDMKTAAEDYPKAVAELDPALESILDAVAKRPGAEILVAGTHGIYLGEDGKFGDSFWIDPVTLKVPLIWSGGRAARGSDARATWLPDVAATIASSGGVTLGPASEGIDLGASADAARARPAWSWAPDDQEAWPNLTSSTDRPATPRTRALSDATRAKVEATGVKLGKTSKTWNQRPQGSDEVVQRLGLARFLITRLRTGPARVTARQGMLKFPDDLGLNSINMYVAWQGTGRDPVKETVETLLTLYPDRQDALHWVAHYEYGAKHMDRAEALSLAALEVGPRDPDILYDLACLRSLAKDVPGGLAYLGQAIDGGFREWDLMDKDTDLAAVRADPKYAELRRAASR